MKQQVAKPRYVSPTTGQGTEDFGESWSPSQEDQWHCQAAQGRAPLPPDLVVSLGKDLSIAGGAQTSSANRPSIYSTAL